MKGEKRIEKKRKEKKRKEKKRKEKNRKEGRDVPQAVSRWPLTAVSALSQAGLYVT
jgi:hypothetical protein